MTKKTHPYQGLPTEQYWRNAVSETLPGEIDPTSDPKFEIRPDMKVSTLGSCFAQHISRFLTKEGFNYFVTEIAPSGVTKAQEASYGVFSARYGNIYTIRQAIQLFDRVFEGWQPKENIWSKDGRWYDALRPSVEPDGFESEEALVLDRIKHFAAVRKIFEESEIIVFTLGLTETWRSSIDGVVFPVAPGVIAGKFDPTLHSFHNFNVKETIDDLTTWIEKVKKINPGVKILLTLSPVYLAATYEKRHVWVSSVASKSILRAAIDFVVKQNEDVDYFPSFEIITHAANRGDFYENNLREVNEMGVRHVMKLFKDNYLIDFSQAKSELKNDIRTDVTSTTKAISAINCDEDLIF